MNEKHNKDLELVNKILFKFKNLGKVHDYVIIDNMLYLSCDVKTDSSYFSVHDEIVRYGHCIDDIKYLDEFRNGFAIIDLTYLEIVKVFCFWGFEEWGGSNISISFKQKEFLILVYGFKSYVLFLKDLDIIQFGGEEYKVYEPYIITFPYNDYFSSATFSLLDTRTKRLANLYNVLPPEYIFEETHYNNNLFIINDRLYFIHPINGFEYNIALEAIIGNTSMEYNRNSFHTNVYNIKNISGISPYSGISLGELVLHNTNDNDFIKEQSSYVAKLIYQIKYQFRKDKISELAHIIVKELKTGEYGIFDIIIPVPTSRPSHEYQPLNETVKIISNLLNIPYDFNYLLSKERIPVRKITDDTTRKNTLEKSLYISDAAKYKNKRILLIDDHIYKGDTINTCIRKCCCSDIFVLVIARNTIVPNIKLPF